MTVQSQTAKSGPYAGAGTKGPFPVDFRFLENGHLRVIKTDTYGQMQTLVLGTDYSVTGAGEEAGGELMLTANLPVGYTLVILRNVPATQMADYVEGDSFPAESHERALDKLTMLVQQQQETLGRALVMPESDTAVSGVLPPIAQRARRYLSFGEDGSPVSTTFDVDAIARASQEAIDAADRSADDADRSDAAAGRAEASEAAAAASEQAAADFAGAVQGLIAGATPSVHRFIGDGVQTQFDLGVTIIDPVNVLVFLDGANQEPVVDYTVDGSVLKFEEAPADGVKGVAFVSPNTALAIGDAKNIVVETAEGFTTVEKYLQLLRYNQKRTPLHYPTLAEAEAAAATLPDYQSVEVDADETRDGRRTRNLVQSGAVVFIGYVPDDTAKGSLAVGHKALGDGAYPETVAESLKWRAPMVYSYMTPEDRIANDLFPGSVDATYALSAAIATGASEIDGGGKTYKLKQKLYLSSNQYIKNMALDLTEMDGGTSGREYAINAQGTMGNGMLLAADALADQGIKPFIVLSAPDAETLTRGSLLFVTQDVYWNSDNNCYVGEMAEVRDVVGTTVYLTEPLLYGYTVANAGKVKKITPVENVGLIDVRAIGPANPAGVMSAAASDCNSYYQGSYVTGRYMGLFGAYCTRNVLVQNLKTELFNRASVEFRMSYNNRLIGDVEIKHNPNYYGCFVADAAMYTWIVDVAFINTRHGVSVGSSNALGGGIVNHLWVRGCKSIGRDACIDCHDEADNVHFLFNEAHCEGTEGNADGFVFQGRNLEAVGNKTSGFVNNGLKIQPTFTYPLPGIIRANGNTTTTTNVKTPTTTVGVMLQCGILGGTTPKIANLDNNIVVGPFTRGVYVSVEAAGTSPLMQWSAKGSQIDGSVGYGIYVLAAGQDIYGGSIIGSQIKMGGSQAYDAINLRADAGRNISGVDTQSHLENAANGVRFTGTGTVDKVDARGNKYKNVSNRVSTLLNALRIALGVVTLRGWVDGSITIETEALAATDDLDTISGGEIGQIIIIGCKSNGKAVVVKDGVNLKLAGDCTLSDIQNSLTLENMGTYWRELSRSINI